MLFEREFFNSLKVVIMLEVSNKDVNLKTKRRINPLLVMLILFGGPYLLSWYTYYSGDMLFFKTGRSQGQLISPVRPLPEFMMPGLDGSAVKREQFMGKWSLLLVGPSQCKQLCQDSLVMMRQVRLAFAVDRQRVQRFMLTTNVSDASTLQSLIKEQHHGLVAFSTENGTGGESFIHALKPEGTIDDFSVFLVDPLANVMMYYSPGTEGKKVLKDLDRLLKFSKVGSS